MMKNINNEMGQIKILEIAPSVSDYSSLRKALGWKIYTEKHTSQALQSSLYIVCVYENNRIIGTGRIVGDSCLCFYIQDVMVVPDKQGQGIGKLIMDNIMNYLHSHSVDDSYIGLMCSKGKNSFYERYGFVVRPNENMGPGMVLPNFKPKDSVP